ncbi:MAG: hypothetical protein Q7T17_17465 [Microbacterium sp.]|uniref:hypothetical protein n=1 Tax=Microbacterium sp. TaxID=51671 RepID=UPI0027191540|nr:hypothetical protein [Microbacterium sp.]MDO8384748.1 hypothetical protein [Microbacterium sp.]
MTLDTQPSPSFEPVLLDLTDPKDYALLVGALEEYAGEMAHRAETEDQRIAYNHLPESASEADHWRAQSERAQRIIDDIERQLDANGVARRRVKDEQTEDGEGHD